MDQLKYSHDNTISIEIIQLDPYLFHKALSLAASCIHSVGSMELTEAQVDQVISISVCVLVAVSALILIRLFIASTFLNK